MVNNSDISGDERDKRANEFSDSPFLVGGFLASVFLLAGHDGEDGGHQGVVDPRGSHSMARGAAWIAQTERADISG